MDGWVAWVDGVGGGGWPWLGHASDAHNQPSRPTGADNPKNRRKSKQETKTRNALVRVPRVRHQQGRPDVEVTGVLCQAVAGLGGLKHLGFGLEGREALAPQTPDLLVAVPADLCESVCVVCVVCWMVGWLVGDGWVSYPNEQSRSIGIIMFHKEYLVDRLDDALGRLPHGLGGQARGAPEGLLHLDDRHLCFWMDGWEGGWMDGWMDG
jgi:hypothetical protein